VSRGLIQFVAVQAGRDGYRTLTADRIVIHPGSVMYREKAQYIVAGEIVRTTRTYAMSVSPLQRSWLPKISELLGERLAGFGRGAETGKQGAGKSGAERDFTNQIKIFDSVFSLEKGKGGKKIVVFQWSELKAMRERLSREPVQAFKDLRGTVRYLRWNFLQGEKIDLILRVAPFVNPKEDLAKGKPKRNNYNSSENPEKLLAALDEVLRLTEVKAKSGELGFICLFTDGQGNYWFKVSRGFNTALNESLASLESLIDELGDQVDQKDKDRVSALYRKISGYLA
jgi:hypothetical protein